MMPYTSVATAPRISTPNTYSPYLRAYHHIHEPGLMAHHVPPPLRCRATVCRASHMPNASVQKPGCRRDNIAAFVQTRETRVQLVKKQVMTSACNECTASWLLWQAGDAGRQHGLDSADGKPRSHQCRSEPRFQNSTLHKVQQSFKGCIWLCLRLNMHQAIHNNHASLIQSAHAHACISSL